MANLGRVLRNLRQERNHAQRELERLDQAISVIEGLAVTMLADDAVQAAQGMRGGTYLPLPEPE